MNRYWLRTVQFRVEEDPRCGLVGTMMGGNTVEIAAVLIDSTVDQLEASMKLAGWSTQRRINAETDRHSMPLFALTGGERPCPGRRIAGSYGLEYQVFNVEPEPAPGREIDEAHVITPTSCACADCARRSVRRLLGRRTSAKPRR